MACLMKMFFELITPEWARNFGVSDETFAHLQTAGTFESVEDQELYIKSHCKRDSIAGALNALSHARDKGLL